MQSTKQQGKKLPKGAQVLSNGTVVVPITPKKTKIGKLEDKLFYLGDAVADLMCRSEHMEDCACLAITVKEPKVCDCGLFEMREKVNKLLGWGPFLHHTSGERRAEHDRGVLRRTGLMSPYMAPGKALYRRCTGDETKSKYIPKGVIQ